MTTSAPGADISEGRMGNLVNYSGVFGTGQNYEKFDFVYATGDGLYYYAKQNMVFGGGVSVSDDQRFTLLPHEAAANSHYIIDEFNRPDDLNATFKPGNIINIAGSTGSSDGNYTILSVQKNYTSTTVENLTGAAIKIKGTSEASFIENYEPSSSNILTISTIDAYPESNPDLWTSNKFFYDADYGSTISFRANNDKHEYGNGYYSLQPKGINSLTFEADLKFNNRTNKEANSIIHFVENHLGQLEVESSSPNLKYKQGVSGFRWDGNAMFNPYRSTENESKTFYCSQFNHSLSFENSNNVNLKLRNLDTSSLRKSEQLFIRKADTFDPTVIYEKNDVAFYTGNHSHYYWYSDSTASNKAPAEITTGFNGRLDYKKDLNTGYWTRDFFWKPSLGLSVDQTPRMNEIELGGYLQIYNDGINESLLSLDLQFNNRDDEEAYAILHFLEQRLGHKPFNFIPPSPYNRKQNFVCQEWTHTYNYKNNHSISARFEQFPFNIEEEDFTNLDTPPELAEGELIFTSPISFSNKDEGEQIIPGEKGKARIKLMNIGDKPVSLYSSSVSTIGDIGTFSIIGQDINSSVPFVGDDLNKEDYIYDLPSAGFPFGLNGKKIKLSKSYTPGVSDGGQMFTVVTGSAGNYKTEIVNSVPNTFFQNNRGQIKSGINETFNTAYRACDKFAIENFFVNNQKSIMEAGEEGYIDIEFFGVGRSDVSVALTDGFSDEIIDNNADTLLLETVNQYYFGELSISSSTLGSPQVGELKIFVAAEK
jgi:phage-related protein